MQSYSRNKAGQITEACGTSKITSQDEGRVVKNRCCHCITCWVMFMLDIFCINLEWQTLPKNMLKFNSHFYTEINRISVVQFDFEKSDKFHQLCFAVQICSEAILVCMEKIVSFNNFDEVVDKLYICSECSLHHWCVILLHGYVWSVHDLLV